MKYEKKNFIKNPDFLNLGKNQDRKYERFSFEIQKK